MTQNAVLKERSAYDSVTGEILQTMTYTAAEGSEDDYSDFPAEWGILEGVHDGTKVYVSDGEAVNRPAMPTFPDVDTIAADGVEIVTFDNIPTGTQVTVNETEIYQVDDGVLEYSTEVAGIYLFEFTLFPYLTERFVINAN